MAEKTNAENQLQKIIAKLKKTIGGVFGEESLILLGQEAAKIIRRRTRLGFGVATSGSARFRLKPLSTRYMILRKENSDKLSEFTRPQRSNLTLHGDMLDDLEPTKVKALRGSVLIGFAKKSSLDKAEWNTATGRAFNNLSNLEIKQLRRFKQKDLGEALRKARL